MSELYYHNLPNVKHVGSFMKDVFYGLNPYYRYLNAVKDYLEQEGVTIINIEIIPQFDWGDVIDELTEEEIIELRKNTKGGIWVELNDEQVEDNYFLMQEVFNQSYFYIAGPEKGTYWRHEDKSKVLGTIKKFGWLCLAKQPVASKIYIRPPTYQIFRILQAISTLQDRPSDHHEPLLRLFKTKWEPSDWEPVPRNYPDKYYFLTDNTRSGVQKQRQFVAMALNSPEFALLNGPPGTGKTTVICEIILHELLKGRRVMLVASTHVAVDNVIERLIVHPVGKNIVFPIRVGSDDNISEDIQPFVYHRRKQTEQKRIKNYLEGINRSEPQEILYKALKQNTSKEVIDDYILNAANLVCGTTIGILQYPPIKNALGSESPPALFDMLILDEASKTPFHEFLVPALYARRWIFAGDPKQLSPYVDAHEVEMALNAVKTESKVNDNQLQVTLPFLELSWDNHILVLVEDKDHLDFYLKHFQQLPTNFRQNKRLIILDHFLQTDPKTPMEIERAVWAADLIVTSMDTFRENSIHLPADLTVYLHQRDHPDNPYRLLAEVDRDYFSRLNLSGDIADKDNHSWSHQIGYRLGRKYELRNLPSKRKRYDSEINTLTPIWATNKLENQLQLLRKVFYPSVLEALIEGFEPGKHRRPSILTDGFPTPVLNDRYIMLEYQHRMHPDIAEFPRNHIYHNSSLHNASHMSRTRKNWSDNVRVKWLDTKQRRARYYNTREIDIIRKHLKEVEEWTKHHDRKDGKPWEVAVLTFYRPQERRLRKMLRKYFRQMRWRKFQRNNLVVEVCTVDRFQGHEADLVYLSMVRNSGFGFLDSPNRLNVAITRARYQLILVGNRYHFRKWGTELLKKLGSEIPKDKYYR